MTPEEIRIEALKCAVMLGTQNVVGFDKTDTIIKRAIQFEEYIILGKDVGA